MHMKKPIRNTIRATPNKLSISVPKSDYDSDFYKWVNTQANLLKKGEFSKLDTENLIEEIESLGKSEKRTLKSYLEVLLMHKLKCEYQSTSWDLSIKESQHKAQTTLLENPSLKSQLKEILDDAYFTARLKAAAQTGLDEKVFPKKCKWTVKEIFPNLKEKYSK